MSDTISAISTALGGAIGIVRMSGPGAERIAQLVVSPWPESVESHRFFRATAAGDEVLCVLMRGPASYTGEDVVELHGHGGAVSLRRLIAATCAAGARAADPGEFTRRAFLNGKMDLARAEAVSQVIAARTERALHAAQAGLRGGVSDVIGRSRGEAVRLLCELEARIDFPEEALDFVPQRELAEGVAKVAGEVEQLASTFFRGRLYNRGLRVALVGPPNAGKSSLLNALLGEERALVTAEPGTTRDYLEGQCDWDGVPVVLIDTAGEREAEDTLERRGIELGRRKAAEADIRVWVTDALAPVVPDAAVDVVALSKSDQLGGSGGGRAPAHPVGAVPHVLTSALRHEGLQALRDAVLARAGLDEEVLDDELVVTSERQSSALGAAAAALRRAEGALREDRPPELGALDLRIGVEQLGQVTGEAVTADVLDLVFSRFCIGK